MSGYAELKEWLSRGASSMFVAMLSILYFVIGRVTSDELASLMTSLSMSYNTTTNILTSGSNTYAVNDLINYVVTTAGVYPDSLPMSSTYMLNVIGTAKSFSLITAAQATSLEALL